MKLRQRTPETRPVSATPTSTAVAQVTTAIAPDERSLLGDVLLSSKLLTPGQLASALNLQMDSGRQLGAILVEQGLLDSGTLTDALAKQHGLPRVDLAYVQPTPEALALVPERIARDHNVMPMRIEGTVLEIAVADAADPAALAALRSLPIASVQMFLAPPEEVRAAVQSQYRVITQADDQLKEIWATEIVNEQDFKNLDGDAPIIKLVNKIISQALRDRASDIHIEPTERRLRVRFRVDGALREVLSLPSSAGTKLISRLKIMADMDIIERRRPLDGQFSLSIDGVSVDVRVATAATIWGETAVLRLLDKHRSMKHLTDLGMPAATLERYQSAVDRPFGMIICSGPTGSGKTTTLYATLAEIGREELNVMTIEDPVEYVLPSINQMQVNNQADVTFANGLRSILRQDPDVILVGEIRDQETARIGVQAALTGHLVMTSLHATDASAALHRLLDMGIEPFLVASSLVSVVAQRLVRRICEYCAEPYQPAASDLAWYARMGGPNKDVFMHGKGCTFCAGTGFRERVGVYEVLSVTDEIRALMLAAAPAHDIRELAVSQGMVTMGSEAVRLVAADVTTIDDVVRNVYVGG